MKIAYFDCFAGASGDMIVAAMLDVGLDAQFLNGELATLGIKDLDVKIAETKRAGLRAIKFVPAVPKQDKHRNLQQIIDIISQSAISDKAKGTASKIFKKLAQAEASVHGKKPEDVHFHEVGAVDSIVDIVSAAVGLEALGIEKVHCSALTVGGGTVRCEHGLLPVPAPATAKLLKGVPVMGGMGEREQVTPTGAAILTAIACAFGPLPAMRIEAVGYGAGSANPEGFANVLRLIVGESADKDASNADSVWMLETNVDDASGELIGSVTDAVLGEGALDAYVTPIFMKENRPGVQISVMCEAQDAPRIEQILFAQGVTLGIRRQVIERRKLAREFVTVATEYGQIRIKRGLLGDRVVSVKPEFGDCKSAAKEHKVAVKRVCEAAMAAYDKMAADKE
jgi:uncharacterized protein (TIGR00299 family) protein